MRHRQRLVAAAQFDQVFRAGQRSADRLFTILYRDNAEGIARIGFAIAKAKVRAATDRNRIRRLVRESFRLHQRELPAVDLVVIAREAAVDASNAEIVASLDRHWARIGPPEARIDA